MTTDTVSIGNGDIVTRNGLRCRVTSIQSINIEGFPYQSMLWASFTPVKKDGSRDWRWKGWSGGLAGWTKEGATP